MKFEDKCFLGLINEWQSQQITTNVSGLNSNKFQLIQQNILLFCFKIYLVCVATFSNVMPLSMASEEKLWYFHPNINMIVKLTRFIKINAL